MMLFFLLFSVWRWRRDVKHAAMTALDKLSNICLLKKSKNECKNALQMQCKKKCTAFAVHLATEEFVGVVLIPKSAHFFLHCRCSALFLALLFLKEKKN